MEGLNMLFNSLYGVKLEHQQPMYGELWSPDVQKLVTHFLYVHICVLMDNDWCSYFKQN